MPQFAMPSESTTTRLRSPGSRSMTLATEPQPWSQPPPRLVDDPASSEPIATAAAACPRALWRSPSTCSVTSLSNDTTDSVSAAPSFPATCRAASFAASIGSPCIEPEASITSARLSGAFGASPESIVGASRSTTRKRTESPAALTSGRSIVASSSSPGAHNCLGTLDLAGGWHFVPGVTPRHEIQAASRTRLPLRIPCRRNGLRLSSTAFQSTTSTGLASSAESSASSSVR